MKSIQETTSDLSNIEVLVGIDDDDAETHDAARHITGWHSFVKFFSRPRSNMLNRDYLNWVYEIGGSGKYIITINDDTLFCTPKWDEIAIAKLDVYLADKPDRIVYGYISDNLPDRHGLNYCCFPLMSREGYLALGFVMPPSYPSWSADGCLWQIFVSVDRICDLSEILIDHISYHTGKRERDHISYHVEKINTGIPYNGVPIEEYANKLREKMLK